MTSERPWPPSLLGELPSRDTVRHPRYQAIVDAIDALPEPQRDLVNALFWEAISQAALGRRLGRSQPWVHMQKRLAVAFVHGFILGRDCEQ